MKRKIFIFLILIIFCFSAYPGCGSNEINKDDNTQDKKIKLTVLNGMVEVADFFDEYFKKYNQENKDGIEIQTEYEKESTKSLDVKFASGNSPDIVIGVVVNQNMIDKGNFVDLTNEPFWDKLSTLDKEFSTDVKSGRAYNVGLCQTAVGLFYNKAIFSELGLKPADTWDEFVNNLKIIKKNKPGVVPFYIGGRDSWMLEHMANFIQGGVIKQKLSFEEQQKAMLDLDLDKLQWNSLFNGTLVTYAKNLMELQKLGLINDDAVKASYGNQIEAFARGKAAVISQGIWAADLISQKNNQINNIGFCQYPSIIRGEKPVIGTGMDVTVYISSKSKYKDACMKVLNYMLQPESMKEISEGRRSMSANPNVYSDWGYLKDDVEKTLNNPKYAVVTWTTMPPYFTGDDEGRMWQDLLVGKYKTAEAFAKAYVNAWENPIN